MSPLDYYIVFWTLSVFIVGGSIFLLWKRARRP